MRFVAIDVETANPNMSSICQIGVVRFEEGRETGNEGFLVDPRTWFCPVHVGIHGIDEQAVRGAPSFPEALARIAPWIEGETVVCHTHFDRVAMGQAAASHGLTPPVCSWLDSARVTRRAWSRFAERGYGLANVAAELGIEFRHHDAMEDARTAGLILLRAIEETGTVLSEWPNRLHQVAPWRQRRTGDGDGPLLGETVVFTGALDIPRRQAADLAAEAGADVEAGVTRHTTLLVVGDQDIAKLNGETKSSKHRKAEGLIAQGQALRIIGESDFMAAIEERENG